MQKKKVYYNIRFMRTITIIILFSLPIMLKAQSVKVDSLVKVLNTQKLSNEKQLEIYVDICNGLSSSDPAKCHMYARKGLAIADKEKNLRMASLFNNFISISFGLQYEKDSSIIYVERALDLAVKIKDAELQTKFNANLGVAYHPYDKQKALDYYLKALALCDKIDNKYFEAMILANIGTIHISLNNKTRAASYLEQAKKTAEEIDSKPAMIRVYSSLSGLHIDKEEYERALYYGLKSVELSKETGNKNFESTGMALMSSAYYMLGDYDKALECSKESLRLAEELGDPAKKNDALLTLARIYLLNEQYKESETTALQAWAEDSTNIKRATSLSFTIAMSNLFMGNKEKASDFFWKLEELSTTLTDQINNETLMNMEVKYETEKKEMRIETLEEERKLYIGLGIAIVIALLSGIGLLVYRHRLTVQKRKLAEQQVIQLEQEKTLIAVQSSLKAEKAERDLIAHDLHDSVSSLLTVVKNNMNLYSASEYKDTNYYNNAFEVLSKSITELRRVVYHLKSFILTKEGLVAALDDFCRFIPNAEFHFKGIDHRFDPDKEYVLYDCTCELINNALKHSGASLIDVHLNMDEQTVYLSVADNGVGFDSRKIILGIGLDNIRSNLSAFGGHLDILSEPDKGTEANIELKV